MLKVLVWLISLSHFNYFDDFEISVRTDIFLFVYFPGLRFQPVTECKDVCPPF